MAVRFEGQAALELAARILQEQFGAVVSRVADVLFRRGACSRADICLQLPSLSWPLIRNSLLVLIAHNIVSYEVPPSASAKAAPPVVYRIDLLAVLLRLRFARYCVIVYERRGVLGRLLFCEILKRGRLTIDACVQAVLDELSTNGDVFGRLMNDEKTAGLIDRLTETNLRNEFAALASHGYIIRVDQPQAAGGGATGAALNSCTESTKAARGESSAAAEDVADTVAAGSATASTEFAPAENEALVVVAEEAAAKAAADAVAAAPTLFTESSDSEALPGDHPAAKRARIAASPKAAKAATKSAASRSQSIAKAKARGRQRKNEISASATETAANAEAVKAAAAKAASSQQLVELDRGLLEIAGIMSPSTESAGHRDASSSRSQQTKDIVDRLSLEKTLFCVNHRELLRLLLQATAHNFTSVRWSGSQVMRGIVQVLLATARLDGVSLIPRPLSMDEIVTQLRMLKDVSIPEQNTLLCLLDALCRVDKTVKSVKDSLQKAAFVFDWERFREIVQRRHIFCAVRALLGEEAGRVLMFLLESNSEVSADSPLELAQGKLWEEADLAEKLCLPPNRARELLLGLAKEGYCRIHLADVVTGAPGNASSKHQLLFAAHGQQVQLRCLKAVYQSILNLAHRKTRETADITAIAQNPLRETEQELLDRKYVGEDIVERQMLHLDDAVLVLRDA